MSCLPKLDMGSCSHKAGRDAGLESHGDSLANTARSQGSQGSKVHSTWHIATGVRDFQVETREGLGSGRHAEQGVEK